MSRLLVRSRMAGVAAFVGLLVSLTGAPPVGAATAVPWVKAGTAVGPFNIVGGFVRANVAHLNLPAGNWTVFAKAEIDNTDTNSNHVNEAICALTISSAFQTTTVYPTWSPADGSRMPILLTVSAHLSVPRTANLACSAPGVATGIEKIRTIRMGAFRSTALSLGVGPYTTKGNPQAYSHIYQGSTAGPINLSTANVFYNVVFMSLPAGKWTVTASATADGAGSGYGHVLCQITTGSDYDQTKIAVAAPVTFGHEVNINQQVDHAAGSGWVAVFRCESDSSNLTPAIYNARLAAYRTRFLKNQDLGVSDTYPAEPPTIRPLVFGGFRDGPIALGSSPKAHTVADQVLPRGRWVVVGKGWLDHSTGISAETVMCRLGSTASTDTATLVLGPHNVIDDIQPFTLMWFGTLSRKTTIALACRTPTGQVTANWVKLNAYRVPTLSVAPLR